VDTVIGLLELNSVQINNLIRAYQPNRSLCIFKGMRSTLPVDAFPSLEIEPTGVSNSWGTVRSQRPRYSLQMTLTTRTNNVNMHLEYIDTLGTMLGSILTNPRNLQLAVSNETKWDQSGGLVQQYILDSLVEDVSWNALQEGTIRTCEFSWFALIHETYPDFSFDVGGSDVPTVLRPRIV
jgi:hypothetical protein